MVFVQFLGEYSFRHNFQVIDAMVGRIRVSVIYPTILKVGRTEINLFMEKSYLQV